MINIFKCILRIIFIKIFVSFYMRILRKIPVFIWFFAVLNYSVSQTVNTISPDGNVRILFRLTQQGEPEYSIIFKNTPFLQWSKLGLKLRNNNYTDNFKFITYETNTIDEVYRVYSGKSAFSRNYYSETKITLKSELTGTGYFDIYFRAYNDGAAFRYGIPKSDADMNIEVVSEDTEFRFAGDFNCWAMKKEKFKHSYEGEFREYLISSIFNNPNDPAAGFPFITLPVTFKVNNNFYAFFSEAAITNYPGAHLVKQNGSVLKTALAPDPSQTGIAFSSSVPLLSPWRFFIFGKTPGALIESNLAMNLNEPNKITGIENWLKPGKTTWSWWAEDRGFDPSFGYSILSTNTVKHYIDFAAANNIQYVTLDGGWYGWFDAMNDFSFRDLTKTLPELNLPEVVSYAENRGVGIILWVVWSDLEKQMDKALDHFERLGIKGIKMDFMDRDDKYMTDFYRKTAGECAKRKLFVMFHGSYKPDGLSRTYPNILTYESVMGNEYSKWDPRFPDPKHNVTIPFTRMPAGPMDYTPGSFTNVASDKFQAVYKHPMTKGTRAQQLAMAVVYESGILTLCESPEIYKKYNEFDFLKNVPATWDSTIVLDGEIGKFVIIARKSGNNWFVGGMTNQDSREINLKLKFLPTGFFKAVIYSDFPSVQTDPQKVQITNFRVKSGNSITIKMAPGGGFAAEFIPE